MPPPPPPPLPLGDLKQKRPFLTTRQQPPPPPRPNNVYATTSKGESAGVAQQHEETHEQARETPILVSPPPPPPKENIIQNAGGQSKEDVIVAPEVGILTKEAEVAEETTGVLSRDAASVREAVMTKLETLSSDAGVIQDASSHEGDVVQTREMVDQQSTMTDDLVERRFEGLQQQLPPTTEESKTDYSVILSDNDAAFSARTEETTPQPNQQSPGSDERATPMPPHEDNRHVNHLHGKNSEPEFRKDAHDSMRPLPPPPPLSSHMVQQKKLPIILQAPNRHESISSSYSANPQRLQQASRRPYDVNTQQQQPLPSAYPSANYGHSSGNHPQERLPQQHYSQQQQLQRNNAYYRSPPPLLSTAPRRQRQHAWKSLWRKIEKGLDSLADVEDAVSGRAQQLFSSTVAAIKVLSVKVPSAVKIIPAVWKPADKVEQMDMSRFRKTVAVPTPPSAEAVEDDSEAETEVDEPKVSVSMNPYGAMLQRTVVQSPLTPVRAEKKNQATVATARSVDWNSVRSGQGPVSGKTSRLIRANGGASTPHDKLYQQPPSPPPAGKDTDSTPANTARTLPQGHPFGGIPTGRQGAASYQAPVTQHSQVNTGTSRVPYSSIVAQSSGRPTPMGTDASHAQRPPQKDPPRRPYPDEDDESTLMERIGRFLPPIPRIRLSFRVGHKSTSRDFANAALDAWKADEAAYLPERRGLLGFFRRKPSDFDSIPRNVAQVEHKDVLTAPIADLMERCREGETSSLLNMKEEEHCRSVGRQKAAFDLMFLAFIIAGARQLPDLSDFRVPRSMVEALTTTVTDLLSFMAASTETWAPFAFAGAFLATKTKTLLCERKENIMAAKAESTIREESQYATLFLRLVSSSVSLERNTPKKMVAATRSQIASKVDIARLQSFVIGILASFLLMTVSVFRPVLTELLGAVSRLVSMEQLRVWPPRGHAIVDGIKSAITPLGRSAGTLIGNAFHGIMDTPSKFAYKASLVCVLVAVTFLPSLEARRRHSPNFDDEEIDREGEHETYFKFTNQVSNLAASGASRLGLLAVDGRLDNVLERWRSMIPQSLETQSDVPFKSVARMVFYGVVSCLLLSGPLLFRRDVVISMVDASNSLLPRWDSSFDVSVVLLFEYHLVLNALAKTVRAEDAKVRITGFVASLARAVKERRDLLCVPPPNLPLQASLSPTDGVAVKDLWASHVTKRAWAVRGANISCQNGEILALLGDDGAGKTRLITVLAESMISPPRRALSSQKVRGSISVGGVDVTKWDNGQLKHRLGIFLNDVRSVCDTAQILTGMSLEEILDPSPGIRNLDTSHSAGPSERAAMMLALKITGLSSTLLQRLPSKLSTIVTASEEDLQPSPLRPRYQILSPAEWSKLLLARVLAQTIYNNENSAGSNDAVINSLVGSVLLLDDPTLHFSEVEEARLLLDLRQSRAATIITSNRWATGRFADRIAVIKDGAIVETGTHSELLNRGPQQSIYAAKWHAMTSA